MVGARYPHKNVDEVLDQARLWSRRYKLLVTSCGGDYRVKLLGKVASLGIADRVEFCDYLTRERLIKLYQGCSALLYPSKWEGFGIPPLEALACGRPVIASDIPVHREVLGESAIFVKLGDASSWASAFDVLQSPSDTAKIMKCAGHVLQRYTWKNTVDALERCLLEVEPELKSKRRTI
jgi:glycosyltransferase involved in cell wall biosynthesis